MITKDMLMDFLKVSYAIDPNIIFPRSAYDPRFTRSEFEIIASRAKSNLSQREAGFSFLDFIKELSSESFDGHIEAAIHDQLMHYSSVWGLLYVTRKEFPRMSIVQSLVEEGAKVENAINTAFSENQILPDIQLWIYDNEYGNTYLEFNLASQEVLDAIQMTSFFKELKQHHSHILNEWVEFQLGKIYPLYKEVAKDEKLKKSFVNEFKLAEFMCLRGLAEALYVYLCEAHVEQNSKDEANKPDLKAYDQDFMEVLQHLRDADRLLKQIEMSSYSLMVKSIKHDVSNVLAGFEMLAKGMSVIKKKKDNYHLIVMIFRITHNLCINCRMQAVSAIRMSDEIIGLLGIKFNSTKARVTDYRRLAESRNM